MNRDFSGLDFIWTLLLFIHHGKNCLTGTCGEVLSRVQRGFSAADRFQLWVVFKQFTTSKFNFHLNSIVLL